LRKAAFMAVVCTRWNPRNLEMYRLIPLTNSFNPLLMMKNRKPSRQHIERHPGTNHMDPIAMPSGKLVSYLKHSAETQPAAEIF